MISSPACGPSREPAPKNGGNWPTSASIAVRPAERVERRVTDAAVASIAAIAIIVKPASPSAGRAASAIAVSP